MQPQYLQRPHPNPLPSQKALRERGAAVVIAATTVAGADLVATQGKDPSDVKSS